MTTTIVASHLGNLPQVISGSHHIRLMIGPTNEIIILSADKPIYPDYERKLFPVPPFSYQVHRRTAEGWRLALSIVATQERFSFAQPLPRDRWLLVEARKQKGRPNAFVYDERGELLGAFDAGDGVEHVQATSRGEVWVGYFDEGVYGGGELEQSGLVCLDETGKPMMRYWHDVAEPNSLPCIDDCYALNVLDDDVWVCYYSHFPIVHLRQRKLEQSWVDWPSKAVRALAFSENKLLMVAAYRRDGLLYSTDLRRRSLSEVTVTDSHGQALSFDASYGRNSVLCFASLKDPSNQALYMIDLRTLL